MFSDRVMTFYDRLERFRWATPEVALLSPVADNERRAAFSAFCTKFYSDDQSRVFWLGINPSRVRKTSTGVPYTDGFALQTYCGIENEFAKNRELTADFFYRFIESYGGASKFYEKHYAGAAYPSSILKKDKYANYYDRDLPKELLDEVPELFKKQAEIGHSGVLIIIGSGQNATVLKKLNDQTKIFSHVLVVEHPRYIMQYKSANLDTYLDKFIETAQNAERLSNF